MLCCASFAAGSPLLNVQLSSLGRMCRLIPSGNVWLSSGSSLGYNPAIREGVASLFVVARPAADR